jgi:hypothetical protein
MASRKLMGMKPLAITDTLIWAILVKKRPTKETSEV